MSQVEADGVALLTVTVHPAAVHALFHVDYSA